VPRRLVAVLLTVVGCLLFTPASQVSATASVAVASGTYTYDGLTLDDAGAAGPRGAGESWQPALFVAALYAYGDMATERVRDDASNGCDKRKLQVNDSRRAAGALSETAGSTSTNPAHAFIATEAVDDVVGVPKPPTGPGAVPPSQRDPRRLYTRQQVEDGLAQQGGTCLQCKSPLDLSDARGHHVTRHADGGPTTSGNLAVVCSTCHIDLHRRDGPR
jgi:hypothetical protein